MKNISKKTLFCSLSGVMLIAALFSCFLTGLKVTNSSITYKTSSIFDVMVGSNGNCTYPLVFALLLVFAAITTIVIAIFFSKQDPSSTVVKASTIITAVCAIIAGLLFIFTKQIYFSSADIPSAIKDFFELGIGAIISSIACFLAGGSAVASIFFEE